MCRFQELPLKFGFTCDGKFLHRLLADVWFRRYDRNQIDFSFHPFNFHLFDYIASIR
jgi:hypothetical protein